MHFAMPPRKSSHPPPYAIRPSRSHFLRRRNVQLISLIALAVIALLFLFSGSSSTNPEAPERIPAGTPEVVIVTTLDRERMSESFIHSITDNRKAYAKKHGYTTFFANTTSYPLGAGSPPSWSKIPTLRHAMTLHPHSTYFFYLAPTCLITNPSLSLTTHIMSPSRIESLMIVDKPVVPPDSVIKTFKHLKGDKVDLVLTQDTEGLGAGSFVVRRGEWAKYFLDAWFDPLYRSYNFQKAEQHALEHLVQWHGTVLARLALVPQKIMNSYTKDMGDKNAVYREGDFIANFIGCDRDDNRNCESEMGPYIQQLQKVSDRS